jgi:DNA helicase IV
VLGPYVPEDRRRLVELHVNYRAPAEVMAVAAAVLADIDPAARVPRSVREAGVRPWRRRVAAAALADELRAAVAAELAAVGEGNIAVLVADGREAELQAALGASAAASAADLKSRVVVLPATQAKGLEFDAVVVVEPAAIVAASPRGRSDLYVALTRATHRLGVLHTEPLPPALAAAGGWAG